MTMESLFNTSFVLVAPFWILMIFAPHWPATKRLMGTAWIAAPASVLYAVLILPRFMEVFPIVLTPDHAAVAALLGSPAGATIGWIHYLAFDLFVGRWVYLDSRERGLSPWIVSPILFFVLMLGPLGFVMYLGLCYVRTVLAARPA